MRTFFRILRLGRLFSEDERGQVLLIAAAGMVAMIGFAGLAIDTGFFFHTKRDIQNGADAMALAAVRQRPDDASSNAIAMEWADKNNIDAGEVVEIDFVNACDGEAIENIVTVRLERNQPTFLAGVLGITDADIAACATAQVGVAAAGDHLLPFGFHVEDPYPGANPQDVCYFYESDGSVNPNLWNNQCLVKIPKPSDSWGSGNAGALRLDEGGPASNYDGDCSPGNSGASEYRENIEEGSECFYAVGDEITPKPGNMNGPTCTAFENRLAGNNDTLEDVFGTPDADGVYRSVDKSSPRFGIVPIVTVSGNGSSADITITGFITVYIDGACSGAGCGGNGNNPACVVMTPVRSNIYLSGIEIAGGSVSMPDNALRTIKLIK
jgi:hypothetical protein